MITSFREDEEFGKRTLESGLFDEVHHFNESETTVAGVERQVDDFLRVHSDIDQFFLCVFSDRFGNLLARRLYGKARLSIFPEGSSTIMLEKKIRLVFQEVYGKIPHIREFYDKHPIELGMFDETWVFDAEASQGDMDLPVREIDMEGLMRQENQNLLSRLNKFFGYDENLIRGYEIIYLDDVLTERNWVFTKMEQEILHIIFGNIGDRKVLVKPHPGQDAAFEKMKFMDKNADIFYAPDIPWELLYLNFLVKTEKKKVTLISSWMSTSIYSSLQLGGAESEIDILSFVKILLPYCGEYALKSDALSKTYYSALADKYNRIHLYLPEGMEELEEVCRRLWGPEEKGCSALEEAGDYSIDFFKRVGNLTAKSCLYSPGNDRLYHAYFEFLKDRSVITFEVYEEADLKEVLWYPSDRYLFDCLRGLKIYLLNRGVKREMDFGIDRIHGRGEPVIIEENRGILLHIPYCGYCEKIVVEAELTVKNKYLDLADKYWNARWQKEFWESWADIQDADRLRRYVEESGIKRVWVFGTGRSGAGSKRLSMGYGCRQNILRRRGNGTIRQGYTGSMSWRLLEGIRIY